MNRTLRLFSLRCLALLAPLFGCLDRAAADPYLASSDLTPTPGGRYVLRAGIPIRFDTAAGDYIQDFAMTVLPGPLIHSPQPVAAGWEVVSSFDVSFSARLGSALGGGGNFGDTPGLNGGDMIAHGAGSLVRTFDTEMLALNLTGSNGTSMMLLRESPTLASTGQTVIETLPGGEFRIDSFFDVFTELSLDGGATWHAADGPMHLVSVPEPSSLLLAGCGMLVLLGVKLRRRRA